MRQLRMNSMKKMRISRKFVGSFVAYRDTSVLMSMANSFTYCIQSSASWRLASSSFAFFYSSSFLASSSFWAFLRSLSATFCK